MARSPQEVLSLVRKGRRRITSSGVSGASTAPSRPSVEHAASRRWRARVGNSSAVYTYSAFSADVAPSLPSRYSAVFQRPLASADRPNMRRE